DRQRNFEAGQSRLSAVYEDDEDRSAGDGRPSESAAAVLRRNERSAGTAQPLQRVARNHERVVPVRSHQGPRPARGRPAKAAVGNGEGEGSRGGEKEPGVGELSAVIFQPSVCGFQLLAVGYWPTFPLLPSLSKDLRMITSRNHAKLTFTEGLCEIWFCWLG